MTTELPSINSTTSISDNVDLRNYYDNLLFKNSSGKSLTDLPKKAAAHGKNAHALSHEVTSSNKDQEPNKEEKKVDFIRGFDNPHPLRTAASHRMPFGSFQMTPSNSEPIPPTASQTVHNTTHGQQQTIFNTVNPMPMLFQSNEASNGPQFAFDFDRNNNYYASNLTQSSLGANSMLSPLGSTATPFYEDQIQHQPLLQQSHFDQQESHSGARRSSYISDTLIHGHLGAVPDVQGTGAFGGQSRKQPRFLSAQMAPPTTAPSAPYNNTTTTQNQGQRRNTQPGISMTSPSTAPYNQNQNANRNRYLNFSKQQQTKQHAPNEEVILENGLVLLNAHQIVSSPDLHALYSDCGSNYFSSQLVYEFTDHIKVMLSSDGDSDDKMSQAISKFLAFLKSCNLNYNPQSDAFTSEKQFASKSPVERKTTLSDDNSRGNSTDKRSTTTSSYLHYKPLVLVALKNGKLELLSTPQNTNIMMKRGDLVIIDGDRGKDLALVVEPTVDLDLALFINFLKKKIHFDSLITSKSQHHVNGTFIQALIDSTRGQNEELNSKLYDVIELTQLIVPSKQVLRFATPWEVTTNLHNKFQDELKALHIAQLKLRSLNNGFTHHHHNGANGHSNGSPPNSGGYTRPQLNIKILNAEFQFDRKKLTFYYVCEERNDFRELIKELFKFYKTRIWLCAIPNNLGIDSKYYDSQRKELKMYQEMMQHYAVDDLSDANAQQGGGFIIAPALNAIELDNFQIGVYRELVNELFG